MAIKTETQIKIYPNPASDKILISWGNYKIQSVLIQDAIGKQINTSNCFKNEKQFALDISNLLPGIYYIILEDINEVKTVKRFIKQ